MFSSSEYYQKAYCFILLFTKYPHTIVKQGCMCYLLFLIFSRIITKDNHSYMRYRNSQDRTFGIPETSVATLHNTHLWMGIAMALSTVSGSEMKVWRIYPKLQIILNWTHMLCICGKPSIWHLSRVPSTNVGENDFSPFKPYAA